MKKNDNVIGKGFDKRPENINKSGRPKKTVLSIITELKSQGYERATVYNVMEIYEYMIGLDEAKLLELSRDIQQPIIIHLVCKAILSNKGFDMLEKMLDRAHGKATNKKELTGKEGEPLTINNIHLFTTEELIKSLQE